MSTGIVWFRQDLRLSDNPALQAARKACDVIVPVFIDDPMVRSVSHLGEASSVWLHHSLSSLGESLKSAGAQLILGQGDSLGVLQKLIGESGATRIFWNRCYDPGSVQRDTEIKKALETLQPKTFNASLLHEPWQVLKKDGTPYRVYTPFWRVSAAQIDEDPSALAPLGGIRTLKGWMPPLGYGSDKGSKSKARTSKSKEPKTEASNAPRFVSSVEAFAWLPELDWPSSMMASWQVGERAAQSRLEAFLKDDVSAYVDARDLPGVQGTSCLSPHLHFGEISPRQILAQLLGNCSVDALDVGQTTFAKEVVWRDFAHSLLYHFPQMPDEPLDRRFTRFAWADNHEADLKAWQRGMTGVPIVDAGMRQLYATGWMHNRVRMIVGSYLVKNLLIPWQEGEAWFQDTLVDADLASNSMGWQWVSGCGADAAPFFRVFNPVLQGEKFDKSGDYVRHWVPELVNVPAKFLHKPWELPAAQAAALSYPAPLVDLMQSRQRALDAFSGIKTGS